MEKEINISKLAKTDSTRKETEAKVLKGIQWIMLPILSFIIGLVGGLLFLTTIPAAANIVLLAVGIVLFIFSLIGCKIIAPNNAIVFTLFGKYVGTTKFTGFIFHNPFYTNYRLSTKFENLPSEIIKVNDKIGNPIEVAAVAVWNVDDTYRALFDVENYFKFISTQFESAVRQMASKHPYDFTEDNDDEHVLTLRQNTAEINDVLTKELQERVSFAGININEARLTHLAYAPEIASVMLKRQQAAAIIDAKTKIVQGSVDMVKMAIDRLDNKDISLSKEQRAMMAQDLMLILCSDKEATPVIDIGRKK